MTARPTHESTTSLVKRYTAMAVDMLGDDASVSLTDDIARFTGRQMRMGWLVRVAHWSFDGGWLELPESDFTEMFGA